MPRAAGATRRRSPARDHRRPCVSASRTCIDHPVRPKLSMPKSAKGGGRNRAQKKAERYSLPTITAARDPIEAGCQWPRRRCAVAAAKRWRALDKNPGQNYHRLVENVVTSIGLDPADVTMYALRTQQHCSHAGARCADPVGGVALHNTSVAMIERYYSRSITEHFVDDIARVGLLSEPAPPADNVVAMVG